MKVLNMTANHHKILRINAGTFPVKPEERRILSTVHAEIIEVEQAAECDCLGQIEGVMIASAYLKTDTVKKLARCRIISRMGTGCDKVDVQQATAQGIIVANVPDALTHEVADHTLALLLSASRKLKYYEACMRSGHRPFDTGNIHRLSTQTLGIIGFGNIGRAVAVRALAFGLRILVSDPAVTAAEAVRLGVTVADKETILRESDYLCLLCPLVPATRNLLAMPEFRLMKRTAVLINTGRGELVNEKDLVEALKSGVIAYAGLDVFGEIDVFGPDGFPCDHPLFGLDTVQLTPHVSANSCEALEEVHSRSAQAVADVFSGKLPSHIVNPSVMNHKERTRL
jgi:D-3-phosphoglycerate dehydrogenase / 2-oxoglutarate reductase